MIRFLVIVTCALAIAMALAVAWRAPTREDPLRGVSDATLRAEAMRMAAARAATPPRIVHEPRDIATSSVPESAPPVALPPAAPSSSPANPLPMVDEERQRQQVRERAVAAARQLPLPPIPARAPAEPWQPPAERAVQQRAALVAPVDAERAAAWRRHRSGGKSPHPHWAIPAWRRP